jgi:hypothetical protein
MSFKSAYGAGYRAGFSETRVAWAAGKRGVKHLIDPLNPYNNPFAPVWRPLLALAWELGRYDGLMKKLTGKETAI